jgi:hypothetical protein
MIFKWVQERKTKASIKRWQAGYDYAIEMIHLEKYEQLEAESYNPFDPNKFDKGIRTALLNHEGYKR